MYPAGTYAYAMYLHDGTLCSGAAVSPQGFLGKAIGAVLPDKTFKSSQWLKSKAGVPRGTPVHVILNMDERTLSFAIGDSEPCVAYKGLPASGVHPYLCSGDIGERSILVAVSGPPPAAEPARRGWW